MDEREANKAMASMSCSNQTESTYEPESWARSLGHLGLAGSFPGEISNPNEEQGQEMNIKTEGLLLMHWLRSAQGRGCTGPPKHPKHKLTASQEHLQGTKGKQLTNH